MVAAGAFATLADFANEALIDDNRNGGKDGISIGTHYEKAFNDSFARPRVEGGDDEMAGESGADGEVGGFIVADFAEDEDLRVLAEQMAGRLGEVKAAGFVDFGLHDARKDLLDGIFDGDDVAAGGLAEMA